MKCSKKCTNVCATIMMALKADAKRSQLDERKALFGKCDFVITCNVAVLFHGIVNFHMHIAQTTVLLSCSKNSFDCRMEMRDELCLATRPSKSIYLVISICFFLRAMYDFQLNSLTKIFVIMKRKKNVEGCSGKKANISVVRNTSFVRISYQNSN